MISHLMPVAICRGIGISCLLFGAVDWRRAIHF